MDKVICFFFFFEGGGSKVSEMDTHFFKGTVPWGPCPAPFLASVTRQATILYAESSSTMLQDYVKWVSSSGWPGCLPSSCVTRSFFPLSFSTKDDAPIFNDNVNNNNDRGMESKSRQFDLIEKPRKRKRRGEDLEPRCSGPDSEGYKSTIYIYIYTHTYVCIYIGPSDASPSDAALPFSCFRLFRLLQIFTAHMLRMIATMKKSIPPTTPAVIALCFTRAGTANFTWSLAP